MPRRTLENRTIEVILLESDRHLGEKFEIVRVKPIFAKNVLLPKGMAVLADANMKNKYKQKIEASEKERAKKAAGFEDLFKKIADNNGITITAKANNEGTLYAKIHEDEIVKLIKEEYGMEPEAHFFKLKNKISEVGTYTIPFIYKELKTDLVLTIKAEGEEKTTAKAEQEEEKAEETIEGTTENTEE